MLLHLHISFAQLQSEMTALDHSSAPISITTNMTAKQGILGAWVFAYCNFIWEESYPLHKCGRIPFFCMEMAVKIADFGVSRILGCNLSVETIAYMSPEQISTNLNHDKHDG